VSNLHHIESLATKSIQLAGFAMELDEGLIKGISPRDAFLSFLK
jgi:hypothetical protein